MVKIKMGIKMNNKFYMLVGLPGCGKSTWSTENKNILFDEIFSSDEYRKNLLGDINNQTNNDLVFNTLYRDMINALKNGKSVCFDATNINRKDRKRCLNKIKNIDCEKIAVFFAVDTTTIKEQNSNREKEVPEFVIDRMLRKFEIPFKGEGFDDIIYIYRNNNEVIYTDVITKMMGFDQKNPHHTYDLFEHCYSASKYLTDCFNDYYSMNDLYFAGLFHDYGKLFTQSIDKNGVGHYYNHENVGAYEFLFLNSLYSIDKYKVAFYINYHMLPFSVEKMNEHNKDELIKQFGDEWDNILLLHEADLQAK